MSLDVPSRGVRAAGPAPRLPSEIFASRRERLLETIGDGVAVIPGATESLKSRDTEYPFRQSSDFYYLTGFDEAGAVAVLTPHDAANRFTLFVRPRDPEREAWVGPRIGVDGAKEHFGADAAYPIAELAERLPALISRADRIHYPIGTGGSLEDRIFEAVTTSRRSRQRNGVGPAGVVDLEASTGSMRVLKEPQELERMRMSAEIAAEGHLAVMRRCRPGMGEWELQGVFEAALRSAGASPAFLTIVGSAGNSTVLHYVNNDRTLGEDDLVLVDAGADWGMYCSDITRTFPASGRFLPHQRDVYDVVLAAEEAAIAATRAGATLPSLHELAVRTLTQGLLDLGILRNGSVDEHIETGAYRRFYPHQTSHWLGLDVHDAGPYVRSAEPVVLQPGMVFTVEPGLYFSSNDPEIPETFRGIGVRIEDDVEVLPDGARVTTRRVPVDPDAIEQLMGERAR